MRRRGIRDMAPPESQVQPWSSLLGIHTHPRVPLSPLLPPNLTGSQESQMERTQKEPMLVVFIKQSNYSI